MRIFAGILVLFTLLVGCFLGYCYYGAQMDIEGVSVSVVPAVEALGTFDQVKTQMAQGSFLGTVYQEANLIMAESYEFHTLTVRMGNKGFLPMDYIEINVVPDGADVAALYTQRTPSLLPRTRGDFSFTILTRTAADTNREVTLTYYVMGKPFSTTYAMPET